MRVLVLRLDAIGDFVLFTSALPHIREIFHDDQITMVVNSEVEPLAKNCPYVNDVWHVDPGRYATDPAYVDQLVHHFRGQFDIALNAMYTRTWQSDNIIARTHAPVKIGFECFDNDARSRQRSQDQILYTELVRTSGKWLFEIDRYRQLLAELGADIDPAELNPVYWITDEDREWAERYIAENLDPGTNIALLCPGGGFDTKRWSGQSFAQIADWLKEKYRMTVVVAGSLQERTLADEISRSSKNGVYDLTGKTSLRQLVALVERTNLYVGIDTAGFHFAWSLGIPTVGIFGGGHFGRFIPSRPNVRIVNFPMDCYYCYWNCIYDETKCVTSITPEMVMEGIEEILRTEPVSKVGE